MIAAQTVEQVGLILERAGLSEQTVAALRESFQGMHFTYCLDDDIGTGVGVAPPVREAEGFRIYLVDGRSHCLRLTADLESATGLVLAQVEPEDEDLPEQAVGAPARATA